MVQPKKPQSNQAKYKAAFATETTEQTDQHRRWLAEHGLVDDELDSESWSGTEVGVEGVLHKLKQDSQQLTMADLFAFSDLSRADNELVRQQWPTLPAPQRIAVLQALNAITEEDVGILIGPFLRIAMRDANATVRQLAIEGLWEENSADLIGPLTQILQHDENVEVQATAGAILGNFVLAGELDELDSALAMRVEQALLAVVEDKTQPLLLQCRALESLAYSSENGIRQLIEDAYYSPAEELRLSALRAMGRSADVHWRNMVRAELDNPDAAMRAEAALATGELETKSATKQLLHLLNDDESAVRLATISALGHIGGKPVRDALRKIANEEEGEHAEAAALALEEMLFYADSADVSLLDDDDELEEDELDRDSNFDVADDDDFDTDDIDDGDDDHDDDDDTDDDEFVGKGKKSRWDEWDDEEAV